MLRMGGGAANLYGERSPTSCRAAGREARSQSHHQRWGLRLEGERNNIEKARQLFSQLEAARQRGMQIHRHEFQYALDVVSGRSPESLGQLAKVQILGSSRRTPIQSED